MAANPQAELLSAATRLARLTEAVTAELQELAARRLQPGLYLVATPIGHLGDMTLRALTTLAAADYVFAEDTRHSRKLLDRYGIGRPLSTLHEHNEIGAAAGIAEAIGRQQAVALISDAGTPLVSDPGFKLVRELNAKGLPVHVVPGASAVMAALSIAGLPTDCFTFAGFLPAKSGHRAERLARLKDAPGTLLLFELPVRLAELLDAMLAGLGDRQAVVVRELTKIHEARRPGRLSELAAWANEVEIKGEIVIVVGAAEPIVANEDEVTAALKARLESLSLRDAVSEVADLSGMPRKEVYRIAVGLKGEAREDE